MHGPFQFRVEESQLALAGRKAMMKRLLQPPIVWMLWAILILGSLLLVIDLQDGAMEIASIAVLAAVPIAIALVNFWLVPWQMRHQFRQSAALQDEFTLSFDDTTITFAGKRGTTTIPLEEFHAVMDAGEIILLYQTEAFFNAVPKAPLGAASGELIASLQERGVRLL